MTSGGVLQKTVMGCLVLAVATVVVGSAVGYMAVGFGLAAGLMLGSLNGYLIQGLLARGAPFVASSLLRILLLSTLVLAAAFVLRGMAWTVPLGIGAAQLVMVGVGMRQGLRA